ncbi:MAG: carbohydrate binding domain-containing protein [Anaerolineae bacterium]|jgi:hypothetical protein
MQYLISLAFVLFLLVAFAGSAVAADDCSTIYQDAAWTISLCPTDPHVPATMTVWLDGVEQSEPAARLEIAHVTDEGASRPTVIALYASGFVRLKQNADPSEPSPFGSSFILGPAYWPDAATYYHNPQLNYLALDTTVLPDGVLRMQARGANHDFDVAYDLACPPPRDRLTRLHVEQTYTATTDVTIDPTRHAEAQGMKLMQASSMFINEGGVCDDGETDCHDSNAARFIGQDLTRHQVAFADVTPSAFVFRSTLPLGSTWLDVLHTDGEGWQGNTPNVRIALDSLPDDHTITPQGWISATTDPNQDNVSLWLHDDLPASQSWTAGQSDQVGYWLLAQDDPAEPWAAHGLRSGLTFLDFEGTFDCFYVHDPGQAVTGTVETIPGYSDTALQLRYNLSGTDGNWVQIRCDFDPPLDLSAYDHLRFDWRGDPAAANSIEVGLIDQTGDTQRIFARGYHHLTHRGWWGQLVVPFNFLAPWHGGDFDPSQVVAFFLSVVKDGTDDAGATGSVAIDDLNAFDVASRTAPSDFATVTTNPTASALAAQWLASQQQGTGLVKSWLEESTCVAHTYDQALALLVFGREGMWAEADALVGALVQAQNANGSWFKSYDCGSSSLPCVHCHEWEGDVAWAIYALSRYLALGGTHSQARSTMEDGATWLTTHLAPDGCLTIDHTEGTLDAWWAFQSAGPDFRDEADGVKQCLLTYYWDDAMGRFQGGRDWQQPYLDNQTWGGVFLRAVGREEEARRALSYAYQVLRLPAQGGQLFGLDGQGGPWSVWNEGLGQYAAVGGAEADEFLQELLAQQRSDGAVPGSPDDFSGGGVWTTSWHGVAPTAWFYFALNQPEPFHAVTWTWLPLVLRNSP